MRRMTGGEASTGHAPSPATRRSPRAVVARLAPTGGGPAVEREFTRTFTVGRSGRCDLQVADPAVAGVHLKVVHDGALWWVRDLGAGPTFHDGARVGVEPVAGGAELLLGTGGTVLTLTVVAAPPTHQSAPDAAAEPPSPSVNGRSAPRPVASGRRAAVAGGPTTGRGGPAEPVPEVARAAARAGVVVAALAREPAERGPQPRAPEPAVAPGRRHSDPAGPGPSAAAASRAALWVWRVATMLALLLLLAASAVAWRRGERLRELRSAAARLFYATRVVELETARLEDLTALQAAPGRSADVAAQRARLRQLEDEYDRFVRDLGLYRGVPADEQVILRVARRFGECDVAAPDGFVAEVRAYVERWRSSGRLAPALRRLREGGHAPAIVRAFADAGLPPEYLYLALQESAFDERAVGPATRSGYAKGMWQFIAPTAQRYGLRVGPRYQEPVYDAADERFDWEKETAAAVRYLKDLQSTEAQASGILAMASYNWGEGNVRAILQRMPESPGERNFWRLLADRTVPRETYDYVLSIVAAAAICADPPLFGFDLECPLEGGEGAGARGLDPVTTGAVPASAQG